MVNILRRCFSGIPNSSILLVIHINFEGLAQEWESDDAFFMWEMARPLKSVKKMRMY
jgi:hypothetical protein